MNRRFKAAASIISLLATVSLTASAAHAAITATTTVAAPAYVQTVNSVERTSTLSVTQTVSVSAASTIASKCVSIEPGPGYPSIIAGHTVRSGVYWCVHPNGVREAIACFDPYLNLRTPDLYRVAALTAFANTTPANAAKAARAVSKYGPLFNKGGAYGTYSNVSTNANSQRAAGYRTFLLYMTGHSTTAAAMKAKLNSTGLAFYNLIATDAKNYAGPYDVTLTLNSKPTIGVAGTVTGKIVSRQSKLAVPTAKVAFSGTGLQFVSRPSTASKGSATATFKPITLDKVGVGFAAYGLSPAAVTVRWSSYKPTSFQRFASPAPSTSASKSVSYSVPFQTIALQGTCPGCTDVGVIKNSTEVCNKDHGNWNLSVNINLNGAVTSKWYPVPLGGCVAAGSMTWATKGYFTAYPVVRLTLGTSVVQKMLPNKVVKDCLAWPVDQGRWERNCASSTITFNLPAQSYAQHVDVVLDGVLKTQDAAAGQPLTLTFSGLACSADHTFDYKVSGLSHVGWTAMWHDAGTLYHIGG